jgi:hypothetical protein
MTLGLPNGLVNFISGQVRKRTDTLLRGSPAYDARAACSLALTVTLWVVDPGRILVGAPRAKGGQCEHANPEWPLLEKSRRPIRRASKCERGAQNETSGSSTQQPSH